MKKILLANQYKNFLQKYTSLLVNWGVHILSTTSGSEALKLHKEHSVDLIISDFELKDMSGCTLCSLIRKDENLQHVPVILTCHNIASRIERAHQSGASAIAIKPIDPIKLLTEIGDFIGSNLIRSKRVAVKIVVTILKYDQEYICSCSDISKAGILLKSDYPLHLGDRIICRFNLPCYGNVETEGEIVRYMTGSECDNHYGVNFIAMKSCYQKAICDYIASCSNGYWGARIIKSDAYINDSNERQTSRVVAKYLL